MTLMPTARRAAWFDLTRHAVRPTLPAAIQAIMQNGILDRVFQEALQPEFLFPAIADSEPWQGGLGDTRTFTRKGLLTPATTPITGSDTTPATYGVEQWSVTMDQYGQAVDTNMLTSSMALASKFLTDVKTLGINAGQSVNQVARNKLYTAYAGGRTWATAATTAGTALTVQSVNGFSVVPVNGVLTPVSAANPLNVTIGGTPNTVIGVNAATSTLTLGTAATVSVGAAAVSAYAPFTVRAVGTNSAYDLTSSNTVTFQMFRAAVARLRRMNVPTVNGYYVAHIDPDTEAQLFADPDFKQAMTGRVDSPVFRDLSIGRAGGIDWVRNIETPMLTNGGSSGTMTVHRPIVLGAGALVAAPFEGIGTLLSGTGVEDVPDIAMVNAAPGVDFARIVRPPQDRLQQVLSTSWSWVGDYGVPSDSLTGDSALYKRGVVLEHA
jgi:hypothetical protein